MPGLVAGEPCRRRGAAGRPAPAVVRLPAVDGLFLRRLARRVPLFLTVHNASLVAHSAASVVGGLAARVQQAGQGDLLDLFAGFVAHTEQTRAHLESLRVGSERIRVLAHPTLDLAGPGSTRLPTNRELRILFFGSIKPYKGVDVLVRAGIELLQANPGCRIDIVGRPFTDLAAERAMVAAAGLEARIGFDLRYVPDDDLAGYLAAATSSVFPYRQIDASGRFHARGGGRQAGRGQRHSALQRAAGQRQYLPGSAGRFVRPSPAALGHPASTIRWRTARLAEQAASRCAARYVSRPAFRHSASTSTRAHRRRRDRSAPTPAAGIRQVPEPDVTKASATP